MVSAPIRGSIKIGAGASAIASYHMASLASNAGDMATPMINAKQGMITTMNTIAAVREIMVGSSGLTLEGRLSADVALIRPVHLRKTIQDALP
jgi:hypothetical protein